MLLAVAACALLSSAEIARVQGETPQSTKSSESRAAGLETESCFYTLPTFTKSISLEVVRGSGVRPFWKRSFHPAERKEEDAPRPERVRGPGDEAFWAGDPRLGGLFVLRKDVMLRLSIGGNETKTGKLKKLRQLARYALKRL